jgi:endonuclease/exonuclease/phosphatase family metal-dependent hydrolase
MPFTKAMCAGIVTYAFRAGQPAALALTVLAAACAPVEVMTTPAAPARLAVLTWNMHAGRGDLPRLLRDLEGGQLLGASAHDMVVLLQEAVQEEASSLRDLAAARGWSMFFVPVHQDGERTRGNAILASQPIGNMRPIALPRERQPRTAAAGAIVVDGRELFVVSAHLENRVSWWKAGIGSDDARGRQAAALVRALPAGAPGIIGGDFNTWLGAGEPAWRLLRRRFGDTPAARTRTFAARLVLDHVFVDLPEGWHASTRVLDDTYRSDHHPVLALVFSTPSASSRAAGR